MPDAVKAKLLEEDITEESFRMLTEDDLKEVWRTLSLLSKKFALFLDPPRDGCEPYKFFFGDMTLVTYIGVIWGEEAFQLFNLFPNLPFTPFLPSPVLESTESVR